MWRKFLVFLIISVCMFGFALSRLDEEGMTPPAGAQVAAPQIDMKDFSQLMQRINSHPFMQKKMQLDMKINQLMEELMNKLGPDIVTKIFSSPEFTGKMSALKENLRRTITASQGDITTDQLKKLTLDMMFKNDEVVKTVLDNVQKLIVNLNADRQAQLKKLLSEIENLVGQVDSLVRSSEFDKFIKDNFADLKKFYSDYLPKLMGNVQQEIHHETNKTMEEVHQNLKDVNNEIQKEHEEFNRDLNKDMNDLNSDLKDMMNDLGN